MADLTSPGTARGHSVPRTHGGVGDGKGAHPLFSTPPALPGSVTQAGNEMEAMITRLLGVQLAGQESRLLSATADIIGEHVGTLRGEIAQERDSRMVDVQRLEARLAALESRPAPCEEPSEIE